jgi:hypothetical protein
MGERSRTMQKRSEPKQHHGVSEVKKTNLSSSKDVPVEQVLRLQRTIGNRAVSRLIRSGTLQANLTLGKPNDIYEKEAEQVVDRVMRMQADIPTGSSIQLQPEEEGEEEVRVKTVADQITPLLQRQPEPEKKEEEEGMIQGKCSNTAGLQRQEEEPEEVTPALESTINFFKAGGQPLPASSRDFFEPRFGADFGKVRLHTGSKAAEAAQAINARAFTTGRHIVFGEGQYAPETTTGKQLLAHELTHTIQQGVSPSWGKTGKSAGSPVSRQNSIYWGSRQRRADRKMIFRKIVNPVKKSLLHIRLHVPDAAGLTTPPQNYKAPNFKFNSFKVAKGWSAKPTLTQKAYEGDNISWFPYKGKHLVTMPIFVAPKVKRVVPVHMKVSAAMSTLIYTGEEEHCKDIKYAYKISLKEANRVLTKFIVGQTFGPEPTQKAAENLVLKTFQKNLAHPKLGSDKTKWAAKYKQLYQMTIIRDQKKWHDIQPANFKVIKKAGSIVGFEAELAKTKFTNIGKIPSAKIIKY